MIAVLILCSSFLSSAGLTFLTRRYVLSKKIIDVPNERSSHCIPTPRGGGLSFVLTFSAMINFFFYQGWIDRSLYYALTGGLSVALIGWLDDIHSLRPLWRAAIQTATAIWAVYWLNGMPSLFQGSLGYMMGIISLVWCINLYNFMDGIDGLAGAEGFFICCSAGLLLMLLGVSGMSLLCFTLAASIAGFLLWNWPPAKIFMGDVGSGYLGYSLGVLAIYTANQQQLSLLYWCVISAVFLFDATFTVIKRKLEGKRWYEAHREHAYQCLVSLGLSHKAVTMSIILFNILILLPVAFLTWYYSQLNNWLISIGVAAFFLIWICIISLKKGLSSN